MFTIRLKSYHFFQYLLVLMHFMPGEVISGHLQKTCAEFNQYCLNHSDCCSNSCMSYMYRCTRGYNVYPYAFLGVSYNPSITLDQILEQNFGVTYSPKVETVAEPRPYFVSRFGPVNDNDVKTSTEKQIIPQNSKETNTSENQERSTTTEKPPCSEIGAKCYRNDECCSQRCHGFLHQCVT